MLNRQWTWLLTATVACGVISCGPTDVQQLEDGGALSGNDGGSPDGGPAFNPCSTPSPQGTAEDYDGDGLPNAIEMISSYAGGNQTNRCLADTDGDGLSDGEEDLNKNGRLEKSSSPPYESDPTRIDSDCDGLTDLEEVRGIFGPVTNPLAADTDGDGILDGVELGLTVANADPACTYQPGVIDADPSTKTDPTKEDTDGDGISDGAEDSNKNGKVDPPELNPNDAGDGTGALNAACATANLKPYKTHATPVGNLQLALAPSYAELTTLKLNGTEQGVMMYDATQKVIALALKRAPTGADVNADQAAGRALVQGLGNVTIPTTVNFTSWDNSPAVADQFEWSNNADLKDAINALAKKFVGDSVEGLFTGASGTQGPFVVQSEYVRRSASETIVLIALMRTSDYSGARAFHLDDIGGGSALAEFPDFTGVHCQAFKSAANGKVDFIWVVDDSCSMQASQTGVSNAGTMFANKLASAGLDWRVGAVTTTYYANTVLSGKNRWRDFTTDVNQFKSWFASSGGNSFGTNGNVSERPLHSARWYFENWVNKASTAPANRLRPDASVHLILMSDADDQSVDSVTGYYLPFFNNFDGNGRKATLHGLVCPKGAQCATDEARNIAGRINEAVQKSPGVEGDIRTAIAGGAPLEQTLNKILTSVIGGTGYPLSRPPIASTIKVAIEQGKTRGVCNTSDVPRSRENGFDFDPTSRKIVFYGNCIPSEMGVTVGVSYRYWQEGAACPADCGGCAPGFVCSYATCSCEGGGIN